MWVLTEWVGQSDSLARLNTSSFPLCPMAGELEKPKQRQMDSWLIFLAIKGQVKAAGFSKWFFERNPVNKGEEVERKPWNQTPRLTLPKQEEREAKNGDAFFALLGLSLNNIIHNSERADGTLLLKWIPKW